jgi:arylsulfatase A-like enzyme
MDVAPTVLELFGMKPPAPMDGRSLVAGGETDGAAAPGPAKKRPAPQGRKT